MKRPSRKDGPPRPRDPLFNSSVQKALAMRQIEHHEVQCCGERCIIEPGEIRHLRVEAFLADGDFAKHSIQHRHALSGIGARATIQYLRFIDGLARLSSRVRAHVPFKV